jgi:outer membrane protein
MNFSIIIRIIFLLLIGFLSVETASSQSASQDSLSLNATISEVVQNHPMVKKALEDVNASDAKIGAVKANYQPYIDFETSYTRIGPISSISIPDLGSFTLFPHDNYTGGINVNQTVFDFGKTDKSVEIEKQGKELNHQTVEQVKQKLSQAVISNYFTLVYLQEAIRIKDEQLNTLKEHLEFVKKKQETGSATRYEILTTQVRISTTENQKTDLETARMVQVSQLNSLLGKPQSIDKRVKMDMTAPLSEMPYDSLISTAMQKRDEMKLANDKAKLAMLRYDFTSRQNSPLVNAFFSGGIKNGYIPDLNQPKVNFAAGLGLKIPIFDGKRNKYNLVQAKSAIQSNDDETEITRRNIISEIVESQGNVRAAQKKVEQSELQYRQATDAYRLAKVSYESGVITNLELLDNSTALSESRLMLLKAKIDHTVNLYKLKSTIGERLY